MSPAYRSPNTLPRLVFLALFLLATPAAAEIITTLIGQAYSSTQEEREDGAAFDVQAYEGTGPAIGAALGLRVNRLEIEPVKVELEMGETYSLRELVVRAYGRNNAFVERVPLTIELEVPDDLIGLELFTADGHTLRADQPGIGRLWINSIIRPFRGENFRLPVVLVVNGRRAIPQPPFLY